VIVRKDWWMDEWLDRNEGIYYHHHYYYHYYYYAK
jgi:hypothetical protein